MMVRVGTCGICYDELERAGANFIVSTIGELSFLREEY